MDTPAAPARQQRIALIHALRDSIEPILAAFARHWPQAETFNVLDDSLSAAVAAQGRLSTPIIERFLALGRHAATSEIGGRRTEALLFTCSAFGPAIEAVQREQSIPVLKPNDGAFEQALRHGRRIGLLVTFRPSLDALAGELRDLAARRGESCEVRGVYVPEALAALQAGRPQEHDAAIAAAAATLGNADAIVLGQFSMARARAAMDPALQRRVLTTPDAAVRQLRERLAAAPSPLLP
jgi:Asp/Glu/hydantoin racemase